MKWYEPFVEMVHDKVFLEFYLKYLAVVLVLSGLTFWFGG